MHPGFLDAKNATKDVKKVVLAYSGGLDTSIILKWLQTTYGCEVVTFTADLGQGEELEPARAKALTLGIKPENIFIEDLREEFVRDYVLAMFRANTVYEGQYLLGTSIARPLIAKKQMEIAERVGADAVAHGATGKGNDQVRFELAYYALKPDVKVIAPWREWDFKSREALLAFAEQTRSRSPRTSAAKRRFQPTPICCTPRPKAKCWKTPRAKCRITSIRAPEDPEKAPDAAELCHDRFRARRRNGNRRQKVDTRSLAHRAQCARQDAWHRPPRSRRKPLRRHEIARHVRDAGRHHSTRRASQRRADPRPRRGASQRRADAKYAELIYNGFWFAPEREMLQAAIDKSQEFVTGRVRLKVYKGNVGVVGRESKYSLYDQDLVTFEDGKTAYDQRDAEGFIRLNALRLRTLGQRKKKLKL